MSDYKQASDALAQARALTTPDSPEWIKINGALAALDDAEVAEIRQDFSKAAQRINDAASKLKALVASLQVNGPSQLIDGLQASLRELNPLLKNAAALLSGEPATALPGTSVDNKPTFPAANEPSTPPVREYARDLVQPVAAAPDAETVDHMIDDILRREGGFVDHPNDRGGPTHFGVTLRTLASWRKPREVTRDDVRRLERSEARDIYTRNYFTGPKIDRLPALLQPIMFDMSINHGPGTAIKLLQEVLGRRAEYKCGVDGGIGDETVRCAKAAADKLGKVLVNELVERRKELFNDIVQRDPSQKVFLVGWLKRADEFRATA